MTSSTRSLASTLPKNWPRRVRSAVIHAISMAHVAITATRSSAANSWNARIRLKAENDRLRQEVSLLQEEIRLKDARMERVPAHRRPHYTPVERLSILELRAARSWSLAQTARRLLVSTATVASWMRRLDEEGAEALVQLREPVNKYPDFIVYIVRRLKVLCPSFGRTRIVQVLGRAGLHLGTTTVARMLRETPRPRKGDVPVTSTSTKRITSRAPNHTWLADLTTVPTSLGLWTSWLPLALPPCWPFCWWIAVVVDHHSRRLMCITAFRQQPTSLAIRRFLGRTMRRAAASPRHLITDQGTQFTDGGFRTWCRRRGIRQRFGAVGKYGSIALVERLIRTVKQECTRRLLVPFVTRELLHELELFSSWYNESRPHQGLAGATPDEVHSGVAPACSTPRYEPRPKWPRRAPCAAPPATVRGRCGVRLALNVSYLEGREHLPIITLDRAA